MSKDLRNLPIEAYGEAEGKGMQRTEMHCHNCSKSFVALVDFSVNGEHEIVCSHCGHHHCRTVKDGKVTEARWDSRSQPADASKVDMWKSDSIAAKTSSVSQFLRDKWLNRSDNYDVAGDN